MFPPLEGDGLLSLGILDVAEPEEVAHLEEGLDFIWGRFPAIPPGFACSQENPSKQVWQGVYP